MPCKEAGVPLTPSPCARTRSLRVRPRLHGIALHGRNPSEGALLLQHDRAAPGQFEPGDERARQRGAATQITIWSACRHQRQEHAKAGSGRTDLRQQSSNSHHGLSHRPERHGRHTIARARFVRQREHDQAGPQQLRNVACPAALG